MVDFDAIHNTHFPCHTFMTSSSRQKVELHGECIVIAFSDGI